MGRYGLIALVIAIVLGGAGYWFTQQTGPSDLVQSLIRQSEFLNGQCRGGSGDDPLTHDACDQRDQLVSVLREKGWCYEKSWQACRQEDLHIPATTEPESDNIHFDPEGARNKEMLSRMEAGTAACSNRLVKGLLKSGMRSRNQIVAQTTSICGQGIKRFLLMQNVPSAAADKYVETIVVDVINSVLQ